MSKILILSYLPVHPATGGGRVRVRALAGHLATRHDVTLLCPELPKNGTHAFPFALRTFRAGGARQLVDPRAYTAVLDAVREERPDLVLVEYIWQGAHAALAKLAYGTPVALDAFDVATARFQRAGDRRWPAISLYERLMLRSADRVFAVSEVDRRRLIELGARPETAAVVPNGVESDAFRPDPAARRRRRRSLGLAKGERMALFFGALDYAANADAVGVLATEIAPRLPHEIRVFVVGSDPNERVQRAHAGSAVTFLGPVDSIPEYLSAADVTLVPLRHGSGTRLKVLESVSSGTPTVATHVAVEGVDTAVCGRALRIADDWDAFAREVETAARRRKSAPPAAFVDAYDWQRIVERVELT